MLLGFFVKVIENLREQHMKKLALAALAVLALAGCESTGMKLGGGTNNTASGNFSSVSGGNYNQASGSY